MNVPKHPAKSGPAQARSRDAGAPAAAALPRPGAPREEMFAFASRHYAGLVTRVALSYENDHALRRELIQDVWLALWVALASFRGDASLKTFVAAIAQKRSISHVTRRAREPRQVALPEDLQSSSLTPDEIAMQKDMRAQLVRSIQALPLPQREAIVLAFEGFSYAEVGDVLGISTNAAMLRCQRAKATLRAHMERKG